LLNTILGTLSSGVAASTGSFESIASATGTGSSGTITFSSIPSTYTDLKVVCVATGSGNFGARFNSDTGSNYTRTDLISSGSSASSYRPGVYQSYIAIDNALFGLNTNPQLYTFDIFSYPGSTFKTTLITNSMDRNGSGETGREVSLWRSTSAITSITLLTGVNTFAAGTTATLYGIL